MLFLGGILNTLTTLTENWNTRRLLLLRTKVVLLSCACLTRLFKFQNLCSVYKEPPGAITTVHSFPFSNWGMTIHRMSDFLGTPSPPASEPYESWALLMARVNENCELTVEIEQSGSKATHECPPMFSRLGSGTNFTFFSSLAAASIESLPPTTTADAHPIWPARAFGQFVIL